MKITFLSLPFVGLALLASSHALAQSGDETLPARPISTSCTWSGRCAFPHFVLGVDLGGSHFAEGSPFGFGTGTGSVTSWGPSWGLRAGVELVSWFAIEAHYIGMSNHADDSVSVGGSRGLFTNAATAELRFTAPTPYVQPYLFFGAGWYATSISGSSTSTQLTSSSELGVPIGLGFQVPLPRGLSLGAEMTYHRFFGESFSENEDFGGGEPLSIAAVLRFRL